MIPAWFAELEAFLHSFGSHILYNQTHETVPFPSFSSISSQQFAKDIDIAIT